MSKTLKPLLLMGILTLGIFASEREMIANAQGAKTGTWLVSSNFSPLKKQWRLSNCIFWKG